MSSNSRKKGCREIPEDIIHDILLRLPVSCLLKFRSVCKSWRDLIRSRSFIDLHLNHPSQNTRSSSSHLLLMKRSEKKPSCTRFSFYSSWNEDDDSLRSIPVDNFPDLPPRMKELYGPCNGIFLVGVCIDDVLEMNKYDPKESVIYLCNPATRECRKLPDHTFVRNYANRESVLGWGFGFDPETNDYKVSLGFGCDPRTNEYKVVALIEHSYKAANGSLVKDHGMDIFGLSSNSWREAGKIFPFINIGGYTLDLNSSASDRFSTRVLDTRGLFFNGHLHWRMLIWKSSGSEEGIISILSLNMSDETMRFFIIPIDLCLCWLDFEYDSGKRLESLLVYEDSLAIVVSDRDADDEMAHSFEIWVMREYGNVDSWTKRCRFGPFDTGIVARDIGLNLRPIACWGDEVLLFQFQDRHLVSFDLGEEDPQPRKHGIRECVDFPMRAIVMDKESLFPLS